VCECACGTGSLTIPLAAKGYQMTGVDLSADMLFEASQKARKAGAMIPFVKQDMRILHLHRQMDAVLATCDGVNYLLTDEDVCAFFRAAWEAMRPGGVLIFDVSTPWKLENVLGNEMIVEDREDVTYMWQNSFNPKKGICEMALCFFLKEKDGRYRRIDEEQKQRAHTREGLTALLTSCGFTDVHVYGNSRMESPRDKEQRWHFTARRSDEA
jgi:2-polyprenyl-3-methyl-5-hydroxy-6-metoxy-1,4-benzoquinol methylase